MESLAHARTEGLIVRELETEVLVYDLECHKAHCLNKTAAAVWRHCDGETPAAEIGFRLAKEFGEPVAEDVVWLALDQLSGLKLLTAPVVRPDGLSRTQLVRRAGLVAAAVALPTAVSLLAPTAAEAVTCGHTGGACTGSGQGTCCNGCVCTGSPLTCQGTC
jgi:coenzyme PQQ synthesis protein D (PqqD)